MDLFKHFTQKLRELAVLNPSDHVLIGVSGGADSLTLMYLFALSRKGLNIQPHVMHVHHAIRGEEADADAEFVAQMAEAWGLPYRITHVDVPQLAQTHRLTLEEAARKARYTALAQYAHEIGASLIAVAHNADDQAETVLMHLLRGSGLAGLRGMQAISPLSSSHLLNKHVGSSLQIIRPLLDVARSEIDAYVTANGLQPRIDSTNADTSYFRNRVRHQVIPMLERISPNLRMAIWRTSNIAAVDQAFIETEAQRALDEITISKPNGFLKLDLQKWLALHLALKREIIRLLAQMASPPVELSFDYIDIAVESLNSIRPREIVLKHFSVRIGTSDITVRLNAYSSDPPDWPLMVPIALLEIGKEGRYEFGEWEFVIEPYFGDRSGVIWDEIHQDQWVAVFSADNIQLPLTLGKRKPGDRFYPQGAGGSQKISDFMINEKIPKIWREWLPILRSGDEIMWVCGYRVDERYIVRPDTQQMWLARFEKITEG